MRTRTKAIIIAAGAFGAVVLLVGAAVGIASALHTRRLNQDVDRLFARANTKQTPAVITGDDLAALPEPVQRWLHWAQVVGQPVPGTVRLQQDGRFKASESGAWMDFRADQYYTTEPPGYVWTVSMNMLPLVSIHGRDQYLDGTGDIEMKILALVPVAREHGGGLDQGAMLRYLGEIIWFPAGALSPEIAWEPIDANHARATMHAGDIAASAIFTIDDEGRPIDVSADRYNNERGEIVPWSGRSHEFGELGGVRVPVAGDGVWHYPAGDHVYIEWRILRIDTDVPARF